MTSEPNDFQEPASQPDPQLASETPTPEVPGSPVVLPADDEPSTEFAALLASEGAAAPSEPRAGDKVSGTIVMITDTEAMIDCGGRSEVPMSIEELRDDKGELVHKVGDHIDGHLAKGKDGDLKFTLAINLREAGKRALAGAFASGTPVEGKVGETNKGGFSISLSGVRAFCPFSQIDLRRADDPSIFVGKSYKFKIVELSEDGRNVVVSRRAFLQEHRDTEATRTPPGAVAGRCARRHGDTAGPVRRLHRYRRHRGPGPHLADFAPARGQSGRCAARRRDREGEGA
jgi:hypothetical protein